MADRFRSGRARGEVVPWLIVGFGGLFVLAYPVETAIFGSFRAEVLLSPGWLTGLLTAAPFFCGLIGGGFWLARSRMDVTRYPRVAKWCFGCAGVFLALNASMVAVWPPDELWFAVGWLRNSANMGGAAGLLIGIVEGRAIQNAIEAERAEIRTEHLETRQDWLDYLNRLLRHEVLNNAQVIDGYSSILLDEDGLDEEDRRRLEIINRQTEDMTEVIGDVRVLIEATREGRRLREVDLGGVVDDELQDLRDAHADVEVETDLPERAVVRADDLLPRVFSNLFENAVEHDDDPPSRLEVSAETRSDVVVVSVADDGPGVPEGERESLFERTSDSPGGFRIGLYLVRRLLERYGGDVTLRETGPDGSVFEVELPLADADDSEPRPQPREPSVSFE